MKTKS